MAALGGLSQSEKVVGQSVWTLSSDFCPSVTIKEALKWLSSLPILM